MCLLQALEKGNYVLKYNQLWEAASEAKASSAFANVPQDLQLAWTDGGSPGALVFLQPTRMTVPPRPGAVRRSRGTFGWLFSVCDGSGISLGHRR
jgi:hypothetical protein